MAEEKGKVYHNKIIERLCKWIERELPQGKTYTTFEDIPVLRDRILKGKLPIDLRYSVDLIHVEKREEEKDRQKDKQAGEKEEVSYYTLFLVSTSSISSEESSQISGISDSFRERLLFYQYYFSSIAEPRNIRTILVVPSCIEISSDAIEEFFNDYKIGLLKIDVDKDEGWEVVVAAEYLRDRMRLEFVKSVNDPVDMGEAIKEIAIEVKVNEPTFRQAVEKKSKDFTVFFEQYILEAIEAISEIDPKQIGKRYIDRKLIDWVFDLQNVSYGTALRDLVNEHLTNKDDDYLFSRRCFDSLWKSNFDGMGFPRTLERFESFLQQFYPEYREHFVHQFQVFLLGTIILGHLLQEPSKLFENGEINVKKDNLAKGWLLASSIHDFTYPLQQYDKFSSEFFKEQLSIDEPLSFLELKGIYVEKTFLTRVEHLLSKLEKDFVDTAGWEKTKLYNEIRRFFYYEITEKKNHGLMGSSYLLKKFEGKDPEILSNLVLPAAVASSMHDDEIWQTLSGQVNGDIEKKWGYIAGLMGVGKDITADILRNTNINDEQKETEIADTLRDKQEEWVGNIYADISNIIIKKPLSEVYLKKQPLTFLLILCDNLQDFGRLSSDKERMKVVEAVDTRLRNISFDAKTVTLTIQLDFNDTEQTLDFMSNKIKLLRKMESYLKSPDIKFIIEYWDRVAGRLKYLFTIN